LGDWFGKGQEDLYINSYIKAPKWDLPVWQYLTPKLANLASFLDF
jgi:hypothetical protein